MNALERTSPSRVAVRPAQDQAGAIVSTSSGVAGSITGFGGLTCRILADACPRDVQTPCATAAAPTGPQRSPGAPSGTRLRPGSRAQTARKMTSDQKVVVQARRRGSG